MEPQLNRQAARSQRAREQIVQAALTVFALKGYTASSMDDVCMAAGCSKGGLYHHFKTKGAVLSGVVDRLALAGALLPPLESAMPVTGIQPEALGRVLIEVWAEAAREGDLRAQLSARYIQHLDAALREPSSAHQVAEILRIGTLIQLLTHADAVDAGEAARRLGIERAA